MLALSVRQPWAHAIIHMGKDIENRTRLLGHRGQTLIHASAGMTREEYDDAIEFMGHAMAKAGAPRRPRPHFDDLKRGGIVGVVEIVDAVRESASPWWMGPCGLVLRNPRPIPFIPCRGTIAPMFWTPAPEVMAQVTAALSA